MGIKINTKLLQILNIAAFLGTILVNTLANALPINGIGTGELSDLYPNLFVPAGITFAIWGVIYLLLLLFIIIQSGKNSKPAVDRIGIYFIISSLANMGWILAWHYRLVAVSLILMLILLGSLLKIYLNLGILKNINTDSSLGTESVFPVTKSFKWFISVPFSTYLGWITVATIANVTALLVHIGWNGFSLPDQFWTVFVILTALGITLTMLIIRRDIAFSLVVVWALAGIVMKRLQADPIPVYSVVYAAAISAGIILLTIPAVIYLKRRR